MVEHRDVVEDVGGAVRPVRKASGEHTVNAKREVCESGCRRDLVGEYDEGVHRGTVEDERDDAFGLTWIVCSVMPCSVEGQGDVDVLAIDAT